MEPFKRNEKRTIYIEEAFKQKLEKAYYQYLKEKRRPVLDFTNENLARVLQREFDLSFKLEHRVVDAFKKNTSLRNSNKGTSLAMKDHMQEFCRRYLDSNFVAQKGVDYIFINDDISEEILKPSGTFLVLIAIQQFTHLDNEQNLALKTIERRLDEFVHNHNFPIKIKSFNIKKIQRNKLSDLAEKFSADIVFWGEYYKDEGQNILLLSYFFQGLNHNQRFIPSDQLQTKEYKSIVEMRFGVLPTDPERVIKWVVAQEAYLRCDYKIAMEYFNLMEIELNRIYNESIPEHLIEKFEILFRKATILLIQENFEKAQELFEAIIQDQKLQKVLANKPELHAKILQNYGILLFKKQDYTLAEKFLLKSLQIEPHWKAYTNLATIKIYKPDPRLDDINTTIAQKMIQKD